eukprot:TRINITY_DN7923_c0_g2_i1.p1 TRINITY_DN7923_c0_g2~~TRINITY_DN7923_c0_g2_i1.p1  ORF type:complete len:1050 (-),score=332.36 TRINITY_DN7923_c0_g2_i1:24-3173(-)
MNQKECIKSLVLSLSQSIRSMEEEPLFVKEKIAEVIVDLVKREWPTRWPQLFPHLFNMINMGESTTELALSVFRAIPEEIMDNTSVPETRRKAILTELKSQVKVLLDLFYNLLETHYNALTTDAKERAWKHLRIVQSVLKTVLPYLEWAPVNLLIESKFPEVFCQLLLNKEERNRACECLYALVTKKSTPEEKGQISTLMNHVPIFFQAIEIKSADPSIDYPFHKRIAQFIASLGLIHISHYAKCPVFPRYAEFLDIAYQFYSHPSPFICSIMIPFWVQAFQHNEITSKNFAKDMAVKLLTLCDSKIEKRNPFKGNPTDPTSQFALIDFDTHEDYINFFGFFRGNMKNLIVVITANQPSLSLELAFIKIKEAFEAAYKHEMEGKGEKDIEIIESRLEVSCTILDWVINVEDSKRDANTKMWAKDNNTLSMAKSIAEFLLCVPVKMPEFLFYLVTSFHHIIQIAKEFNTTPILKMIMEKTISIINDDSVENYKSQQQAIEQSLPPSLHNLRRKCCTLLTYYCKEATKEILANCPQVVQALQGILMTNKILLSERAFVVDMLTALSRGSPDQNAFLKGFLDPILLKWNEPELSNILNLNSDFKTFVTNLQINSNNPTPTMSPAMNNCGFVVETMVVICKNGLNSIDASTLQQFLPNLAGLIHLIHDLYTPAGVASIVSPFQSVLEMTESTINQILNLPPKRQNNNNVQLSAIESHLKHIQYWLEHAREQSYLVFTHFMKRPELYSFPNVADYLQRSLFHELPHVHPRHYKLLLQYPMKSLVLHCPPQYYSTILGPLFLHLFNVTFENLNNGWLKQAQSTISAKNEKMEVVDDKCLRDTTREYFSFIKDGLMIVKKNENNPNDVEYEFTEFSKFALTSPILVVPLMKSIVTSFDWPDSITMSRSIFLTTKLIAPLSQSGEGTVWLMEILKATMKAISLPKNQDNHLNLVNLARQILVAHPTTGQAIPTIFPNCTIQIAEQLVTMLSNTKEEKKQRQTLESFFESIGIVLTSPAEARKKILDLPEKPTASTRNQPPTWHDETHDIGLNSLWDS